MLQLTSYERMRRYISDVPGTALTDSISAKREIVNWIASVSHQVEQYLDRYLQVASYTEYFDVGNGVREFFTKGTPITTLTSVKEDSTGLWDGSESTIDDCFVGPNNNSIILPLSLPYAEKKSLQVIYTGGLASHGVRSTFSVANITNFSVGKYAVSDNDALGIIKTIGALSITIEVIYGIFSAGDTINQYDDEGTTLSSPAATTLISSVTSQSLCESYPALTRAAEIQVRHYWKHKSDFELSSTNKDGTNIKRQGDSLQLPFIQEVMSLLSPFRRGIA